MAYTWNVYGHKKQLELLEKSISSGKLAHALVFAGPVGVGKRTVAGSLAQILLCENRTGCGICPNCRSLKNGINPDLIEVSSGETIKIEQVRKLIYQLNLKPYQSPYKVAVIDNAHDMTTEAANALLKSMEEPKDFTIVILVTSNPYRLLPTILSRAQKLNFGLVDESEYAPMVEGKLSATQKAALKDFAAGRPGIAEEILRDEANIERLNKLAESFKLYLASDTAERMVMASKLAEEEDFTVAEALDFYLSGLERLLIESADSGVAQKISHVAHAKQMLSSNVNSKLFLANMMLGTDKIK